MAHAIMPHGGSVLSACPSVSELNRLWAISIQFPTEARTYPTTSPPPRIPCSLVFYAFSFLPCAASPSRRMASWEDRQFS